MCGPEGMIDAARYYEVKEGFQDKAVMLYHKVFLFFYFYKFVYF